MRTGDLVAERFELGPRIGAGGMGEIFRAMDRVTKAPVAVKVLHDAVRKHAARFLREAEVLAGLSHPGIVRYVAHDVTAEGEPYLVMEWLEGEDLKARLERTPLSLRESLMVVSRVAEALGVAHARSMVHRDLKPSNVFLVGGSVEHVRVLDFGIAHVDGRTQLTETGVLLGTIGYMAPEQARRGGTVDARADVFALGALLFRCLTGRAVFEGDHPVAVLSKILMDEAPRVRELCPDLPQDVDALCARMLTKEPEGRPRDGAEVAAAIEAVLSGGTSSLSLRPAAPSITANERRMLSVVLMGSAAAPGSHTASGTGELATEANLALGRAAEPYGGRLERLADGSVLVTLAAEDQVATDHAARSARCALALRRQHPELPMALVMGRSEVTGRGLTSAVIDQAARLLLRSAEGQRIGSSMSIALDEVTAGLLDAHFEVVEGEAGPLLLGDHELTLGARRLLGKPIACVGREVELTTLTAILSECLEASVARAVLVAAQAGVGKSRLGAEFLDRVKRLGVPVAVWKARGDSLRAGSTLGMLGQALRSALGVREGEPLEVRRAAIKARVEEHVPAVDRARVAEFLGELSGTPFPDEESLPLRSARGDPQLMRDQLRRAFLDFVGAEARARPLVLVLEDLHWGDVATVRYVDAALHDLEDAPLMVLGLARPEVFELFPKLWAERSVQMIRLKELSRKASERLVRQALGDSVGAETVERLVQRAAGNAFYLEELIRAAAEGRSEELPETVLAMVEAHLGRLSGDERQVLRAASVFGEVCWESAVAKLLPGAMRASAVLGALVEQELLVRRRDSRFLGEQELSFRHALLRDGAYAMLTEEDKRAGHRLAGEWLEEHGDADIAGLGGHFERGGELMRAAHFYARAAEQALSNNNLEGVLAHAERGLSCGLEGEARGALLACLSLTHHWRVDCAAGLRCGTEGLPLLSPGSHAWCRCMFGMLPAAMFSGQRDRFSELSRTLLSTDPADDAQPAYLETVSVLVTNYCLGGARDAARAVLARMDQLAAGARVLDTRTRGWLEYCRMIYLDLAEPDPWASWCTAVEARRLFEACGHRCMVANLMPSIGSDEIDLFGFEQGVATMRAGLALAESIDVVLSIALCKMFLAWALASRGSPEHLEEAHALAEDLLGKVDPRTFFSGFARCALAMVAERRGDAARAVELAHQGHEVLAMTPGAVHIGFLAHIRALLAARRNTEARALGEEGLTYAETIGVGGGSNIPLRLVATEARLAAGDREGAAEALRATVAALAERARRIPDESVRAHYLGANPAHVRVAELARSLLVDGGSPSTSRGTLTR